MGAQHYSRTIRICAPALSKWLESLGAQAEQSKKEPDFFP